MKRLAYLWEKYGPPKLIEIFDGREDLDKKPEIPSDKRTGVIRKFKELTDRGHDRRKELLAKLKRKRKS